MNVQMRKVADLIPYDRNAKEHDKKQISNVAKSIQKYGFVQPVVVDKDNVIVIGHCRVLGAKKLKLEEVPCVCVDDLTPEQVNELRIVDNKTNESPWDTDILVEDLPFLPGLDEFEFDFNLPKQVLTGEDDDFDLSAALEKASFVVRGDVWTVGKHRLMCGDATIIDDVAKLMDGKKANCLLTDPPYGVSFKSSSGLTIQNDSMKEEEFYQFLYDAFTAAASFLVAGGAGYVFHADTEGLNFRKAFIGAGFHLAGCCIWVKDSLVLGRSDYQWQHEPCLYGFLQTGKHEWYADRKQTTVWNFAKPKRNKNHPTSKPLDLLCYPIGNSTQENGIVLDTFGGSGSTMMACEQTNRICYTMELDEKYASVILRRAVENGINPDDIFVERDGKKLMYADLVKEVETK